MFMFFTIQLRVPWYQDITVYTYQAQKFGDVKTLNNHGSSDQNPCDILVHTAGFIGIPIVCLL